MSVTHKHILPTASICLLDNLAYTHLIVTDLACRNLRTSSMTLGLRINKTVACEIKIDRTWHRKPSVRPEALPV